eukprot:gnl/Carplike_NY0171/6405_a8802_213.p1 GENE.gnl/Carplike_NY0171/6405_a8802_213~~gnl/Carplike_NY0171/6405_a8802_213.p1  ORF type:complete len:232 (-),score=51.54 gnl/Carplike_NY0171/6405_a8802_213:572-1201(-)
MDKKGARTPFQVAYDEGGIPVVLDHGAVKHAVSWRQELHTLRNDQIMLVAQGLSSCVHPYIVVAPLAWKDLMENEGVRAKLTDEFSMKIARALRIVLNEVNIASHSPQSMTAAINALNGVAQFCEALSRSSSAVSGGGLKFLPLTGQGNTKIGIDTELVKAILPGMRPHAISKTPQVRKACHAALDVIVACGGTSVKSEIKRKIPTYRG